MKLLKPICIATFLIVSLISVVKSNDNLKSRHLMEDELLLQVNGLMAFPLETSNSDDQYELEYDENTNESDLETKLKRYVIEKINSQLDQEIEIDAIKILEIEKLPTNRLEKRQTNIILSTSYQLYFKNASTLKKAMIIDKLRSAIFTSFPGTSVEERNYGKICFDTVPTQTTTEATTTATTEETTTTTEVTTTAEETTTTTEVTTTTEQTTTPSYVTETVIVEKITFQVEFGFTIETTNQTIVDAYSAPLEQRTAEQQALVNQINNFYTSQLQQNFASDPNFDSITNFVISVNNVRKRFAESQNAFIDFRVSFNNADKIEDINVAQKILTQLKNITERSTSWKRHVQEELDPNFSTYKDNGKSIEPNREEALIFKPEDYTIICDNRQIVVKSVSFGVSDEHMCPYTSSFSTEFDSECVETEFATRLIKKKCDYRNSCVISMDEPFIDKCPCLANKALDVAYECI